MSAWSALGLYAMPGPTLLLMLVLILPYMLFLDKPPATGRLDVGRLLLVAVPAAIFLGAFSCWPRPLFPARLNEVMSGNDPSFFYGCRDPPWPASTSSTVIRSPAPD